MSDDMFVGKTNQVAIVCDDIYREMDGLIALGIGPWMVFSVGPENSSLRYLGQEAEISFKVAFTTHGGMMWEVIQPMAGRSAYTDFLDEDRQGVHHIGVECAGDFGAQAAELERRGYVEVQRGEAFSGAVPFGYYRGSTPGSPLLEIFEFPAGFSPQPEEWYPRQS